MISRGRVLNIGVAYNELNRFTFAYIAQIMNETEYRIVHYVGFSLVL